MKLNLLRLTTKRVYSTTATPVLSTTILKGEKNPAHRSKIALPPSKEPEPITHSPVNLPPLEESFPKKRSGIIEQQQEEEIIEPTTTNKNDSLLLESLSSVPLISTPPLPPLPKNEPLIIEPIAKIRRPVGGFRGGLIGFLLGTTLVGGYGYTVLWEDFKSSSNLLLMSVEEAKASAEKMNSHIQRIQRVEEELKRYIRDTANKKDISDVRTELNKLNSAAHIDHLALKARQWGIEQELHRLSSRGSNEVRI